MIGRLRGVLVGRRESNVMVEVGGVGYEADMIPRDIAGLPGIGEEIVVHTHTHVREDQMGLFAFGAEQDRDLFRTLLTATGVGPKLAMAMLASMSAEVIVRAVVNEDPDALTITPGVGKRSAQKIVLELGPKLASQTIDMTGSGDLASVRQALESLGYSPGEIGEAMTEIDPTRPLDEQIKAALQTLGNMR